MNKWFLVVVSYTKEYRDGTLKRVSEHYLLNAVSFMDAEKKIYEEVGETVRGEFVVKDIKKKPVEDIFLYEDSENMFELKVKYIVEDADSGQEKKLVKLFIVEAKDIIEACQRFKEMMSGAMSCFTITAVSVSKIEQIFTTEGFQYEIEEVESVN